ncbi:hypothetical protein HON22_01040 [Candidatus Peregrinibacteria bacterium]|jgi:hypothetical protein|nr:hypothetical protein [Candidatus Peregrinibacteria bacterium]
MSDIHQWIDYATALEIQKEGGETFISGMVIGTTEKIYRSASMSTIMLQEEAGENVNGVEIAGGYTPHFNYRNNPGRQITSQLRDRFIELGRGDIIEGTVVRD